MKKCVLVLLMSVIATQTANAQLNGIELEDFSFEAGLGFFAEDNFDGFMLNFGPSFHIDDNWSAGVDMQFGFEDDDDALLFSMPFYGQYDFNNFNTDIDIVKDMHAFAKLGMGFTHVDVDDFANDTGFLFVIGGGVAYTLTDHIDIESRMQFNITTNDFFEDDFYFSWEVISARYRF